MVQAGQQMELTVGIDTGVALAVAVGYDLIAGAVDDAGGALITGGGFVNGQGGGI